MQIKNYCIKYPVFLRFRDQIFNRFYDLNIFILCLIAIPEKTLGIFLYFLILKYFQSIKFTNINSLILMASF